MPMREGQGCTDNSAGKSSSCIELQQPGMHTDVWAGTGLVAVMLAVRPTCSLDGRLLRLLGLLDGISLSQGTAVLMGEHLQSKQGIQHSKATTCCVQTHSVARQHLYPGCHAMHHGQCNCLKTLQMLSRYKRLRIDQRPAARWFVPTLTNLGRSFSQLSRILRATWLPVNLRWR